MAGPLVFLGLSWLLFSVAAGFVFYAVADIIAEYDFSGYFYVAKRFLRRGPILKSIFVVTACAVTFIATVANILFYLNLAATRGAAYLILAGVMLWFLLFVLMTFALTLPLAAQRHMTTLRAVRLAALLSLSRPLRMLVILVTAGAIVLIAFVSGAGVGFFVVSVPAALFNSEVRVRIEEIEEREPPTDSTAQG